MSLLNKASFLVTPNGYKEDKLYAAIPINGNGDMTVTRATTATRVNEAGLVELVPYNLIGRSQELDNAAWGKTAISVTANATIAPDGTLTADKLIPNTTNTNHRITSTTMLLTQGNKYTFSFYAKAGEYDTVHVFDNTWAGTAVGYYNLVTGVTSTPASTLQPTISMEAVGDGWYRCICTAAALSTVSTPGFSRIGVGATKNIIGDGTSGLFVWGAQTVGGTSALTYQKTVDRLDIPRIDYTGGGCPSILLEPQRTNIVLRSEEFRNASFEKNLSEVSANTTTAPDGTLTADTWTGNGASGTHYIAQTVSATSGVAYTQSVFAKKGTNKFLQIVGSASIYTTATVFANFDLENGVVGSLGTGATATITDFGNGWYRCTMTATATATASGNGFLLWLITSATAGRVETNSLETSVHLWGAQVEAGAHPTSYIPTTTGTVTRNADVLSRDNIYTNNLIVAGGGTWFVELDNNTALNRDTFSYSTFLGTSSAGGANALTLTFGIGRAIIRKRVSSVETTLYSTTTDTAKILFKWNGATADVFVNGEKVVSATLFNATAMEHLGANGNDTIKYIKQMALFPTVLTDAECIALTTL
jgi:hypothetical protein